MANIFFLFGKSVLSNLQQGRVIQVDFFVVDGIRGEKGKEGGKEGERNGDVTNPIATYHPLFDTTLYL